MAEFIKDRLNILFEVFVTFPAKTIVVLRRVCPSWYHMLISPHFTWRNAENICIGSPQLLLYQPSHAYKFNMEDHLENLASPSKHVDNPGKLLGHLMALYA